MKEKQAMEYMKLMREAPPLKVAGLDGDYRLLADFNGVVLAGHPTKFGTEFITWDWDFNRKGLSHGHYYMDYEAAKKDFAVRSGLIAESHLFKEEQLIEIYRCCADTIEDSYDLTYKQEQCIKAVQEQIRDIIPDIMEHIVMRDKNISKMDRHRL